MDINDNLESPMMLKIGFNKLLEHYETLAVNNDEFLSAKTKRVLNTVEPFPELREGFSDIQIFRKKKKGDKCYSSRFICACFNK